MIKSFITFFTLNVITTGGYAQVDSVNTQSLHLNIHQLSGDTKTYVVYLQDSINGMKYNFEIWERTIKKDKNSRTNTLLWSRHKTTKGEHYEYEITFDDQLKPVSEKAIHQSAKDENVTSEKKYFLYENDGLYTSADTMLHNTKAFKLDSLHNSFNWEMDLEILASLPLSENKNFAINFYHPGSNTPPKYYMYTVERRESLRFNETSFSCWVVKAVYSEHQSSEFWIDRDTHNVLQMKEQFYGRYRLKQLVL